MFIYCCRCSPYLTKKRNTGASHSTAYCFSSLESSRLWLTYYRLLYLVYLKSKMQL